MFLATLVPGAILIGFYLAYYLVAGLIDPPAGGDAEPPSMSAGQWFGLLLRGLVLPVGLVSLVLGSIIFGWATPPQSGAVGAAGGVLLILLNRRLSWPVIRDVVATTTLLTAMVFFIIMAAAVFSYPFRYFGGDGVISAALAALEMGPWGTLLLIVGIIFVLGFFIDWIEIAVITLPLFVPVLETLDFGAHGGDAAAVMLWMATLVALTLQTSFLTPPFGFALFFLKGAVPPGVSLLDIYRGIVPIVIAQLLGIGLLLAWPEIATWLPARTFG
jgi:TRAP-type mannitol/chloroaromatic compound transport system permease large subunit